MGNTNSVAFNINGGRNVSNMILVDGSLADQPALGAALFST